MFLYLVGCDDRRCTLKTTVTLRKKSGRKAALLSHMFTVHLLFYFGLNGRKNVENGTTKCQRYVLLYVELANRRGQTVALLKENLSEIIELTLQKVLYYYLRSNVDSFFYFIHFRKHFYFLQYNNYSLLIYWFLSSINHCRYFLNCQT